MRCAVLCGLMVVIGIANSARADEAEDRTQIQAARQSWMKAFYQGDTETMGRLETDEFVAIAGSLISSKTEQLAGIKQRVDAGEWLPPGISSKNINVKIRFVNQDVAIVSGHEGNIGPGEDEPQIRFAVTEVWQRTDDGWRVAHLHFHPLQASDESSSDN